MESYRLPQATKKAVGFCYWSTFVLLPVFPVYWFAVVFLVEEQVLEVGAYIVHIYYALCALLCAFLGGMWVYAASYVRFLWRKGYKREMMKALLFFLAIHWWSGYVWFYWFEIKRREIRSLFFLPWR